MLLSSNFPFDITKHFPFQEPFYFLGHKAVYSSQSQSMFQKNILAPSSGLESKSSSKSSSSRKQAESSLALMMEVT
jgi:hypothetical protein